MRILSDADRARISEAIKEAEKKTSGEIVVMSVEASSDYRWTHGFWSVMGLFVASVILFFLPDHGIVWTLTWQSFGMFAGLLLSFLPFLKRLTIPKSYLQHRVHREALANFLASGLHRTRDRTGVLVYLSELEHRVHILADEGIHSQVGEGYWKSQVATIIEGIRTRKAADALVRAVTEIGDRLSTHFPRRQDDTDELSNEVKTRRE